MTKTESYDVVIIGSGFGGMSAAIELNRRGITNYVMLERRDFMGGTWCQNVYPGAAVDVQSPLYSLSSEPWDWPRLFSEGADLRAYTNHVIDKHGLRAKTRLNCNVSELRWNADKQRWGIRTENGQQFDAQFVINASGPLSKPVIPEFAGRDSFSGASFHTNAWDHSADLSGKRVAIIGSGASAAQVIPELAPRVEHLHVFQRTPHWVMPRPDHEFTPLQRKILRNPVAYRAVRSLIYWQLETRVIGFKYSKTLMNAIAQRSALKHLENQVRNEELRRKLTPEFVIGCKRIIISNTYYPALCRANVTLHDRDDAVARIVPNGIVTANATEVPLDVIVYSTGYDAVDGPISFPIIGRGGVELSEQWRDFPRAYLGTTMPNFPNLFVVVGPNTGIGHTSALFVIESQMRYIMGCIDLVRQQRARAIEVLPAAEEQYTTEIHREMERTVWKSGGCRSWYQSRSGHVIAMFPGFSFTFWRLTGRVRREAHQLVP